MDIEIGDDTFTKNPNILEELAYRDTWGKGADSFIAMIYERLILMRDLLADNGSIYVHCDWRVNTYIRMVMDEVFGKENFVNEIIWHYKTGGIGAKWFSRKHDTIFYFSKTNDYIFHSQKEKSYLTSGMASAKEGTPTAEKYGLIKDEGGTFRMATARDVWDFGAIYRNSPELLGYPTQKPETLLERIIKASSNEGDIVADFFCGSGTTSAVAEKLGRKWIGSDLGKFAIHTTRKRIIGAQRQLKKDGKNYRAFEVLNLGKYERQHYIGVNPRLTDAEREGQIEQKSREYQHLILTAYSATPIEQSKVFHGKKAGRMVAVGPINLPVARLFVERIIIECQQCQITKADVLGFEFEMGLFPQIQQEARKKGIDLALKYIPAEVFDKRAVERAEVIFHDVAYIEVEIEKDKGGVAVSLMDFSVHYSQDSLKTTIAALKNNKSKVIADQGQIVRISKDRQGSVSRETLTEKWSDWVDYWSVDFDFQNKHEVIRVKDEATGKVEEKWTGDYVFENEWQSFRTRKDRTLELKTPFHSKYGKKIAIKVVDIFGNDTMKIVEVEE